MMSSKLPSNFLEIKNSVSRELYENVLPFWSKYSHDDEYGGWFACLDKDGDIYDERKFIWLNGRQLWMFARLCSDVSSADIRDRSRGLLESEKLLHQAERAADFLLAHSFSKEGLAYFSLSRQGRPYSFQTKCSLHASSALVWEAFQNILLFQERAFIGPRQESYSYLSLI